MNISRPLAAVAAAALLSLTACSGSSDSGTSADNQAVGGSADGGAGGGTGDMAVPPEAASAPEAAKDADGGAARSAVDLVEQQAVIKNGAVSLRSDDVGKARFGVQTLVDGVNGSVADEKTETDKTGDALRSRLVVRVPSASFDEVMSSLAELGQLASRTSSAEDVTTQVIDVEAQIKVQEASVQRVRQLLTRAQSIRDIMAIESELANRQAQLDSLTQQQAYLKNQTSLATINVSIERTEAVVTKEEDRTGFLGGLRAGWDGLRATVVAVLTVVGAVLPFAALALLVGVPLWLLVRRLHHSSGSLPTRVTDAAP